MLVKKAMHVNGCTVFKNRTLVYFFVLRPAYRSKEGHIESDSLAKFPVAFFVDPASIRSPGHVYPFDTGAAAAGAFDKKAEEQVPLEDYALEPSFRGAADFLSWAFDDLESYYDGQISPRLLDEVEDAEMVTSSYLAIARMGAIGSNEHDKRASTIECSSSHNVRVGDNVRLLIIPKQLAEKKKEVIEGVERLEKMGTQIRFYDWQPNLAPNEYQADIIRIARDWYVEQGILREMD
jgi:hypothetical protein